jgi:hypothetical protein
MSNVIGSELFRLGAGIAAETSRADRRARDAVLRVR